MSIRLCLRELSRGTITRGRDSQLNADDIVELEAIIDACDEVQELYKDFNLILAKAVADAASEERAGIPIPYASVLERLNELIEFSDGLRKDATHFIIQTTKARPAKAVRS